MPARVKLKGIDGGPHKRWSMWFNSMVREEPYPGLTCTVMPRRRGSPAMGPCAGAAWLSSARAVRCLVKSSNERNPCCLLPAHNGGDSGGTAGDKPEEGGDDVKSSWPLCPGLHTCYNGDSVKLESLVIAHQHGAVNTFPGLVHTARHTIRVGCARSRQANPQGGPLPKASPARGVKS